MGSKTRLSESVYASVGGSAMTTPLESLTPTCAWCHKHPGLSPFLPFLGHNTSPICDCCLKRIWEETLRNVTKSLAELKVRCPDVLVKEDADAHLS